MPVTYRFLIVLAVHNVLWGWILSGLGMLGAPGYALSYLFFPLLFIGSGGHLKELGKLPGEGKRLGQRWALRFRRRQILPLLFFVLASLVVLGGLLYTPSNYDGLSYRVPRMLHWLAESTWHVVVSPNERMNFQGATWEWVGLPLLALAGSERFLWLTNLVAWLAMPGMFFSFLRWLGVSPRTAWTWMWIFPSAFGFVLQAASIGNDILGASLALGSLYFGSRFARHARVSDLICGMFCVALVTGVKISNLPLALPWLVLVFSNVWSIGWRQVPRCLVCGLIGALISVIPIAAVNQMRVGDFTGAPLMGDVRSATNPFAGVAGNTILLAVQSLAPPVLPVPKSKLDATFVAALPQGVRDFLSPHFETNFTSSGLGELQIEESAGLGLGVSGLLLLTIAAGLPALFKRKGPLRWPVLIFAGASLIASLAFMAKAGMIPSGRLFAPYYAALVGLILLAFPTSILWRTRLGKLAAACALLFAILVVIVTPARPLFPAITLLKAAMAKSSNTNLARALDVYEVYRDRPFMYKPLVQNLPESAREVGLIVMGDEPETSLWRPLGSRRIRHLVSEGSLTSSTEPPEYVLVSTYGLAIAKGSLPEILERWKAEIINRQSIRFRVSSGPVEWLVLKRKTAPSQ